jgi:biopolymer transport protein ExbB
MNISLRRPRRGRWMILALATAGLVPSACFLDAAGLGGSTSSSGGGGGAGAGGDAGPDTGTGAGGNTGGGGAGPDGGDAGDAGDTNTLCGNGTIDPGEECEGTNLSGKTCASLGHTGGQLACDASCKLDETGCFTYPTNWYDVAWHHRSAVTIQPGQAPADLTSFPVMLFVNDKTLLGKLQTSGADVLVTSGDGKTKLDHEIERFDAAAGELVVWVRVPTVFAAAPTPLFLYYGNATTTDQQNVAGVWDASSLTVLHLGEKATAGMTGAVHHDATGHGFDGAQQGNGNVPGKIGQGQSFDGVSNYIDLMNPAGLVIGASDCTMSAWIKTVPGANGLGIVTKATGNVGAPNNKLIAVVTNKKMGYQNGINGAFAANGADVNDGAWHHVTWTQMLGGTTWDLYVDGSHDHISAASSAADPAGYTVRIGASATGSAYAPGFFAGAIDEVRISSTARSSAWVLASYRNQGNPATFYTLGAEEGMLP